MVPAELAITDAMRAVEEAGANERLTEAVVLLSRARECVALIAEVLRTAEAWTAEHDEHHYHAHTHKALLEAVHALRRHGC